MVNSFANHNSGVLKIMDELIELHPLRVFVAVARHLSFTRAAEELFMSQPAVSLQVKSLEESLGTKLFLRSPGQIALTPAGEALLARAQEIIESSARLRELVDMAKRRDPARIQVGVSTAAMLSVMTAIAGTLERYRERSRIDIKPAGSESLLEGLHDNRTDFAIVTGPVESPLLKAEELCRDELILIVSPQHRWAALPAIAARELGSELLLVREVGAGSRAALDQALRKKRVTPGRLLELSDQATLARGVMVGMGAGILPRRAVECHLASGAVKEVPLKDLRLPLPVHLVYHQDKIFRPLEREIVSEIFRFCDRPQRI